MLRMNKMIRDNISICIVMSSRIRIMMVNQFGGLCMSKIVSIFLKIIELMLSVNRRQCFIKLSVDFTQVYRLTCLCSIKTLRLRLKHGQVLKKHRKSFLSIMMSTGEECLIILKGLIIYYSFIKFI